MTERIEIIESLKNGIQRDSRYGVNMPWLEACTNLRATEWGLRDFHELNDPVAVGATPAWPFPQLHRGKKFTHFLDAASIYQVNESTWGKTSKVAYSLTLRDTIQGLTGGGQWHVADFHDFQFWCNGVEAVIANANSSTYWRTANRIPQTCCNHKDGRLLLGGFPNGASWWNGISSISSWLQPYFDNAPTAIETWLDTFAAGQFQNWIWWSSIGMGDYLGLWLLEYLYHGNVTYTEKLTNGNFASGDLTGWTANPGWTYSAGKALHTAGSSDYLSQEDIIEHGMYYYYAFTVSGRTAGTVKIQALGSLDTTVSTNATHSGYFVGDTTGPDLDFIASTSFDGSVDDVKLIQLGANLGHTADNPWFKTLAARNESGMMPLPVRGQVQRMLPLGDAVVCYTDDGLAAAVAFSNPVATYGVREIDNLQRIGVAGRGAAGGGEHGHLFMDTSGSLWGISKDLTAERIGYQHIFADFLDNNPIIEYDEQHQEWYISADNTVGYECYVFSKNGGLSKSPLVPTSVAFAAGGLVSGYVFEGSGDPDVVEVTTGRIRAGITRDIPSLTHIVLVTQDTDATGWSIYVDYKMDVGDAWTASELFSTDARGHAHCKVMGIEFRIRLQHPDRSKCDLDAILLEFDNGERRSIDRLLP